MKIAIDARETEASHKAGKAWYAYWLIRHFLKVATDLEIILYGRGPRAPFPVPSYAEWKQVKGRGLFWFRNIFSEVRRSRPDIYFSPTSFIVPALLSSKSQSIRPIRPIIVVHDLIAFIHPKGHNFKATWIERATLPLALKNAAQVVAVSENTARDLTRLFAVPRERLTIIPPGPIIASKEAQGSGKPIFDGPYFLAVGTIAPRKNYERLTEAFSKVHAKHPKARLIIVGSKGWRSKATIKKARNATGVELFGYASPEELRTLYKHARALIIPSLYEGFGMPALEALQLGCPVISSHSSSLPEVVGSASITINPLNTEDITEAMLALMEDAAKRQELIKKGYLQAASFSWEKSAQSLYEFIKSTKI